jgi:putative tricarboxylic transport membrane protein
MDRGARNTSELIFNIVLLIVGGIIIGMSFKLGFGTLKKPGTGLVPLWTGLIILISAIMLIIPGARAKARGTFFSKQEIITYSLITLVFIGWIVTMPFLGYILGTFLCTYCFSKIMRLPGWLRPFCLSLGTTLFCYLLFDFWFYIDLPRGILG